jgi:hypothetical protein
MPETPGHDELDEDEQAEAQERSLGEALPVTLEDEDDEEGEADEQQ